MKTEDALKTQVAYSWSEQVQKNENKTKSESLAKDKNVRIRSVLKTSIYGVVRNKKIWCAKTVNFFASGSKWWKAKQLQRDRQLK